MATMKRIKEARMRNIVIVGGSHSGFSAAWMLMNGPADILHNTHVKPTCQLKHAKRTRVHFPDAVFKTISECKVCCTCKTKVQKCSCVCKCCGFFRYRDWDYDYDELPTWPEASIKILYRDKIRVFYNKVQIATQDGYTEFKQMNFSNKNGYLYSFTGLRGDAKRLYHSIKSGKERRV
jgi:hypothetical protein